MTSEASVLLQIFLALKLLRECRPPASVSSRANDCTDFVFEVSRFTEEAAGSRKEILSEWDTGDLDCIPASAGDSLCS